MPSKTSPLKGLESIPPTSNSHEIADYIELLCLVSQDGRVSKADVIDLVRERVEDLGEGKPTDLPDIEDEELIEDQGLDKPEDAGPIVANDKWEERINDWFKNLDYRVRSFAESYPFRLIKNGTVLVLRGSKLRMNQQRKLYVFLLLASNLRYFTKPDQTSIASIFEVASWHALARYLPGDAKVYMFGRHALNTGNYSGSLWGKVNRLAADIGEKVVCEKSDFKPTNTGDAGLDLVGWLPFEHTSDEMTRGFLLAFGQCACATNWPKKQYETHYDTWKNYISFTAYPFRLTFIPYCFRDATGDWFDWTKIGMTVLVDRPRLMNLIGTSPKKLKPHIARHVDDVLKNARSVV